MPQEFKNMGGSSNSEPSFLRRWITSQLMKRMSDQDRMQRNRKKAERKRKSAGEPHRVIYFHQVEDPYSYLAVQLLPALQKLYDIELEFHLVSGPPGANAPEPDLLLPYSQMDCAEVAPYYGLEFPTHEIVPAQAQVELAGRILAASDASRLPRDLLAVSAALWSCQPDQLEALAADMPQVSAEEASRAIAEGDEQRQALGHYSPAMFYYGGEWYWGVDRLYHLENRLRDLGALREPEAPLSAPLLAPLLVPLLAPRPPIEAGALKDNGSLTLEIYPSLRSPYTSFIFDHAVALAKDTGVSVELRPVLPMVMRGTPVTRIKGQYIMFDTGREAAHLGMRWGNAWDPIGEPVRKAFALFPWAQSQGKGAELLSAFMHCAFFERVQTHRESGLRAVVERAGLDWQEARGHLQDREWEQLLENNRLEMYSHNIWGVPSFRLLNQQGDCLLATWGADRLWLVARRIEEALLKSQTQAGKGSAEL